MTDPTRHGDRPSHILHWTEVEKPEEKHYRGDDE